MKLIVGLGNPGVKYEKTRHNAGFMALDHFLQDITPVDQTVWQEKKAFHALVAEIEWQRTKPDPLLEKLILVKPLTYMNNSGQAVAAVANFYKIPTSDIWLVYDDVDFSVGTLKIRQGGGSAGHRGVQSVMAAIGADEFWRFRIGIGRSGEVGSGVEKHVLDTFTHEDTSKLRDALKHTSKALQLALEKDLSAAMNRYNNSK